MGVIDSELKLTSLETHKEIIVVWEREEKRKEKERWLKVGRGQEVVNGERLNRKELKIYPPSSFDQSTQNPL